MEKQRQSCRIEVHPMPDVERGRLLLDVPIARVEIPLAVKSYADQSEFKSKDEYHVTVIGKKTQEQLLTKGVLDDVVRLLEDTTQWSIVSLDDILLLRNIETNSTGGRVVEESIIQLVTLSDIGAFYNDVRKTTGLDIPTPPAHITLFTKNADHGIGLYSSAQLAAYTVKKLA